MLDCGHPDECWNQYYDECRWCSDVRELKSQVAELIKCLNRQAVILHPGTHDLTAGEIGYMDVREGASVNIHPPVAVQSLQHPASIPPAGSPRIETDSTADRT